MPAGVEMVESRIDREIEVRVPVGRSHPLAVDANPGGGFGGGFVSGVVFQEINQRFAGVGLVGVSLIRMLTLGRFHGELGVGIATSGDLQVLRRPGIRREEWL